MNFVKINNILVNRLLLTLRCGHQCYVTARINSSAISQMHLNRKHCTVLAQNKTIFKLTIRDEKQFSLLDNQIDLCPNLMSVRSMAKGRDKPREKKGNKPKVILTDEEMSELIPINELKIELNNVINKFKADLTSNVSVRSNPQSIEK